MLHILAKLWQTARVPFLVRQKKSKCFQCFQYLYPRSKYYHVISISQVMILEDSPNFRRGAIIQARPPNFSDVLGSRRNMPEFKISNGISLSNFSTEEHS